MVQSLCFLKEEADHLKSQLYCTHVHVLVILAVVACVPAINYVGDSTFQVGLPVSDISMGVSDLVFNQVNTIVLLKEIARRPLSKIHTPRSMKYDGYATNPFCGTFR